MEGILTTKPTPWTLSQQMTKNPNLWEGLVFAVPLWEGVGLPYQIGSNGHTFAMANSGTWEKGTEGTALNFNGTSEETYWSPSSIDDLDADISIAMFIDIDVSSIPATGGFLVHRSSFAAGYHGFGTTLTDLAYFLHDGTFSTVDSGFSVTSDTGRHTYGVIREIGGSWKFYRDGVQVGSTQTDTRIPGSGSHDLILGNIATGGANTIQGKYYSAAFWKNTSITADDMMYLHNNPTALFIPAGF